MNLNQFVAYRITSILNVLRITSCKYPKMSRDKPKNRTDRCAGHILQNAKFSLTSSPKIGNSSVSRMGGFGSLGRKDWSGEVVKVLRGTHCMSYVVCHMSFAKPIHTPQSNMLRGCGLIDGTIWSCTMVPTPLRVERSSIVFVHRYAEGSTDVLISTVRALEVAYSRGGSWTSFGQANRGMPLLTSIYSNWGCMMNI